jgi:hypothetical protein
MKCWGCPFLEQNKYLTNLYRCKLGHFDLTSGPDWFTENGIRKPNKTVQRLQETICDKETR